MGLRLATRGSALALAQARGVAALLGGGELVEAGSDGEAGDKSRFVGAVEGAILEGRADLGVHSAKDLPLTMPDELMIAGVPAREEAADAWVGPGTSLSEIPEGARVGTASLRRRAQLLAARPDLQVVELNGNVDTRLRRLGEGTVDGVVLAAAGLRRLGREGEIAFRFEPGEMTPAAGQGALILQARRDDGRVLGACAAVTDEPALVELTAERAAVSLLGADCTSPVGVRARCQDERLLLEGFAGLADGSEWVRDRLEGKIGEASEAGAELARRMIAAGAGELLERAGAAA